MSSEPPAPDQSLEEPPPLLRSWRSLYAVVAIELGITVVILYALARWAS
jgi:hypothetical protein